ncbi:YfhL family 4Fe-4S dicluster ferredoxin [Chloroflexota bacterium]
MAYKIAGDCISCGTCEPECPNTAISSGGSGLTIDPEKCTECVGSSYDSPRCEQVCPVDACMPDPEHQEPREQLLAKWKKLHPGETPAVT